MNRPNARTFLIPLLIGCIASGSVLADKPSWAGGGKGDRHEQRGYDDDDGGHGSKKGKHDSHEDRTLVSLNIGTYFNNQQRQAAHAYYGEQFRAGKCPPGLAKKNNGCLPPGQAKQWAMGKPLGGISYYAVPAGVISRLGQPPAGYKYVRVASDILMIAIGTGMVVDAIEDLGRM